MKKIREFFKNLLLVSIEDKKAIRLRGGEMDRATFLFFMFVVMQILFAIAEL